MNTIQLELGVNQKAGMRNARRGRMQRAKWWFRKMREVVDLALPAQAMVLPRPEQTYLTLTTSSQFGDGRTASQ